MRAKREDSGPDQVVQVLSLFSFGFLPADFDILCVYERFRVDGLKRYVNDDRFRVDGDKNITSVCVYNRLRVDGVLGYLSVVS